MSAAKVSAQSIPLDEKIDDKAMAGRFARVKKIVLVQSWIMSVLALMFVFIVPFSQPAYLFYALMPDRQTIQMVGLDVPNMTNRAVLSWATNSVTETMTMGFGDIDLKLRQQRPRFTATGWKAYSNALKADDVVATFKQRQYVLTTVPSNTPVMTGQGVNVDGIYQWNLQMPVIMTYATNNNVTRHQRKIVQLTIVRVAPEENASSIAIESWDEM